MKKSSSEDRDAPEQTRFRSLLVPIDLADLGSCATQEWGEVLDTALDRSNVRPEDAPVWMTHVRHGPPRTVVTNAVRANETELLVRGTHGYTGAGYLFLGTVAGDVLRGARCDVMVVPPARSRGTRTSAKNREGE